MSFTFPDLASKGACSSLNNIQPKGKPRPTEKQIRTGAIKEDASTTGDTRLQEGKGQPPWGKGCQITQCPLHRLPLGSKQGLRSSHPYLPTPLTLLSLILSASTNPLEKDEEKQYLIRLGSFKRRVVIF